jgi:hypothetical protein
MTATRIECDSSQDGKYRFEIMHFSNPHGRHRIPNPSWLPVFDPNRPGPFPRTIYDVHDEANPHIQYFWASVPPSSYFAPSEKARKEGARTIYDIIGPRYHTVLVAAIPTESNTSSAASNVATKPNAAATATAKEFRNLTLEPPPPHLPLANPFNVDSNPLSVYSGLPKRVRSTLNDERRSLPRINKTDNNPSPYVGPL